MRKLVLLNAMVRLRKFIFLTRFFARNNFCLPEFFGEYLGGLHEMSNTSFIWCHGIFASCLYQSSLQFSWTYVGFYVFELQFIIRFLYVSNLEVSECIQDIFGVNSISAGFFWITKRERVKLYYFQWKTSFS